MRLSNGKQSSKTFERLTDANRWLALQNAEKKRNEIYGIDAPKKIKFKNLVTDWFNLKAKSVEQRSGYEYSAILKKHILPTFGEYFLTDLRKIDAEKFIVELAELKLSASRIKKIYVLLKGIITYALHHNYIVRDPFLGVKTPKIKDQKRDYLEKIEVDQLLNTAFKTDRTIYGVILIAVNLGLRLSEVIGLHWDQIDFERKRLYVNKKATRYGIQDYAKHGKHRTVYLSQTVYNYLKELQLRNPFQKFVFNENGIPLDYEHFKARSFDKVVTQAGLRKITFHSLRHTYASHFVMSGGNIQELQPLLGHADIKTTLIYAHLSENHLESLASVVEFGKNQVSKDKVTEISQHPTG